MSQEITLSLLVLMKKEFSTNKQTDTDGPHDIMSYEELKDGSFEMSMNEADAISIYTSLSTPVKANNDMVPPYQSSPSVSMSRYTMRSRRNSGKSRQCRSADSRFAKVSLTWLWLFDFSAYVALILCKESEDDPSRLIQARPGDDPVP